MYLVHVYNNTDPELCPRKCQAEALVGGFLMRGLVVPYCCITPALWLRVTVCFCD